MLALSLCRQAKLTQALAFELFDASAAVFRATNDALSRPLPHVYQTDSQGTTAPIVPLDQSRQEAATSMGTAGVYNPVRVQNLTDISQKHVRLQKSCPFHDKLLMLLLWSACGLMTLCICS